MKLKNVALGLASYIPGAYRLLAKGTGGTDTARYCYSVWLRHLIMARKNGLERLPASVAELGPGDSLGIGLAALLCGAEKYFAVDVVPHANARKNLQILGELIPLFQNRENIPGADELPDVKPYLESYAFPSDVLTDEILDTTLAPGRVERIRQSIEETNRERSMIRYIAPWLHTDNLEKETVDFIFSQAVMEHVDDLRGSYQAMYAWLKPAGLMSHQIDFKCHGLAGEWNGHWAYSDFRWKLIRGNRPYIINREPHSTHLKLMKKCGFRVLCDITIRTSSNIRSAGLAPRFRNLSEEDLSTSGAFIQATK